MSDTHFHPDCPQIVRDILERARKSQTRISVYYGSMGTGREWGDIETGRVGRSTGPKKVLLIVYNKRSIGGSAILTSSIVRITHANKKEGGDLYCHPKQPKILTKSEIREDHAWQVRDWHAKRTKVNG